MVKLTMITECYKVLPISELQLYVQKNSKEDSDDQLKTNYALVYYLKSGEVVLMPGSHSERGKGLLFKDVNCFKNFEKMDSFPIENEKKVLEEKYQSTILSLNTKIPEILSNLTKLVNDNQKEDSIPSLLEKSKKKVYKKDEKVNIYSGLLLGEYIRRTYNGKWILLKIYGTFNPYYTPAILYPDNSVLLLRNKLKTYFENQSITLDTFINLDFIKDPGLKFGGTFFKNNYSGYILLE